MSARHLPPFTRLAPGRHRSALTIAWMDHSEPRVFGNRHSPAETVGFEPEGVLESGALRFIMGRGEVEGLTQFCGQDCSAHTSIDSDCPQESGRDQHFDQKFSQAKRRPQAPMGSNYGNN